MIPNRVLQVVIVSASLWLVACSGVSAGPDSAGENDQGSNGGDDGQVAAPASISQNLSIERSVQGRLIDKAGDPVAGVAISVSSFHADQTSPSTVTDADGRFTLTGLLDGNVLLRTDHGSYYPELIPVYLQGATAAVFLEDAMLVARQSGRVRLFMSGDTMFGRRFEDKDEDGRLGEPGDLIRPGSRAADATALFRFIQAALDIADYRIVNFESPASTNHATRHPFKQYSFTSHPDTLSALASAGVDSVSLGNNHSYDYLEQGQIDTIDSFDAFDIDWFGVGDSQTDALNSRLSPLATALNDVKFTLQGFNGIKPINFFPDPGTPWDQQFWYYAMDSGQNLGGGQVALVDKPGALLLSSTTLTSFLGDAGLSDRIKIPVLHGGHEYLEFPSNFMRNRMAQSCREGAAIVKCHHSHTVYGVALWDDEGAAAEHSLVLCSLGNFIFDQEVFETFNSYVAIVDLDTDGLDPVQHRIHHVKLIPFHAEDYVPALISGPQAAAMGRHVGHLSTYLNSALYHADTGSFPSDLEGAVVFPAAAGIAVAVRDSDYQTSCQDVVRELGLTGGTSRVYDLQADGHPARCLDSFTGPAGSSLRLGRDLLLYGDFEDADIDDGVAENINWFQTATRYPTRERVRSGRNAMVLFRQTGTTTTVHTNPMNRITFPEDADLSLHMHMRADNVGGITITAEYIQRGTRDVLGTVTLLDRGADDFNWRQFDLALDPPAAAGHLRLKVTLTPAKKGAAILYLDDLALINWEHSIASGATLPSPNNFRFAQLMGAGGASQTSITEHHLIYRRAGVPAAICEQSD